MTTEPLVPTTPVVNDHSGGIYPPPLHSGDTVALLSPSSRLNTIFPVRLESATSALQELGFKVSTNFTPIPAHFTHQQSILHRVEELHSAFTNPSIKAIICTIGGLSSNELLPFINWELIKNHPKIFVGFSDITVLHSAIWKLTGLRTFYGPHGLTQFGEYPEPMEFTLKHFLKVLAPTPKNVGLPVGIIPRSPLWTDDILEWEYQAEQIASGGPLEPRRLDKINPRWDWIRGGACCGRIVGGCLPSLLQLSGTKYFPSFKDKILLIETPSGEKAAENDERTQSLLGDLVNLGVLDEIVGLIVGRPHGYSETQLKSFKKIIGRVCAGEKVDGQQRMFPILCGVDVGHTDPLVTVPLNALARLDSEEDVWEVLEAGVL